MIEGLRGKPVHVAGRMTAPIQRLDDLRTPGTNFYQAGRLKHVDDDGRVRDGRYGERAQ